MRCWDGSPPSGGCGTDAFNAMPTHYVRGTHQGRGSLTLSLGELGPLMRLRPRRRKDRIMRHAWTSKAGLGACSVIAVLLLSSASWAEPKQTVFACKCTCRYEDVLGNEHFGPSGAVAVTESSAEKCLGHACTVTTKDGTFSGTTRDCTFTEKSAVSVPTGSLPTAQTIPAVTTTTQPRLINIPGSIPGTLTR